MFLVHGWTSLDVGPIFPHINKKNAETSYLPITRSDVWPPSWFIVAPCRNWSKLAQRLITYTFIAIFRKLGKDLHLQPSRPTTRKRVLLSHERSSSLHRKWRLSCQRSMMTCFTLQPQQHQQQPTDSACTAQRSSPPLLSEEVASH